MSRIKHNKDPHARITTEISVEENRRLVSHTVPEQDKDTSPEIPVRQLLLHHERMLAQKKAKREAPSSDISTTPTGPGVYIKVGKGKVIWVEGDTSEETPIQLKNKIFG